MDLQLVVASLSSLGSLSNLLGSIGSLLSDLLGSLLDLLLNLLLDLLGLLGDGLFLLGWWGDVGIDLPLSVLLDEVGEVLDGTGASVFNWGGLGASWEELDGWEALDLIWDVVGGGIDLGDNDLVSEILVEVGELIVLWSESLAVTAPWGVELNEDVLVVVDDDVLVAVGNDDGDWALLGLWDWLRLDGWGDLAGGEVLNELGDGLLSELLVLWEWVLGVLGGLLDGESWPLGLEVEVWSVGTEGDSVNGGKVDLALVLLGKTADGLGEGLLLLWGLEEDVGEWDASGHVSLVGVWANLTNQWSGSDLGELGDLLGGELAIEDGLALIEGLVENDGWGLDAISLSEGGISSDTEEEVITEAVGNTGEDLVGLLVVLREVGDDNDLVGLLELLNRRVIELGDGWQGLLGHVGNDGVGLAWAGVGLVVVEATEDLDGWVTLNLELLAKVGLLGTVAVNLLLAKNPRVGRGIELEEELSWIERTSLRVGYP